MKLTIYGWSPDVERLVKGPFRLVDGMVSGRRGFGQGAAAREVRGRRDAGWRARGGGAHLVVAGRLGGHDAPGHGRGMVDRQATTLMYAGWDRRSAIRRKVPLTRNAAGLAVA